MGFKRRFQRVTVLWRDTSSCHGWQDDDEDRQVMECESSGYLLRETATAIELAQSHAAHNVADVMVIPRECILRVTRI